MMYVMNLLDKAYVSLGQADGDEDWSSWSKNWETIIFHADENIRNLIAGSKDSICNLPNMYLDTEDLVSQKVEELSNSTDYLYTDTYFSVVSETNFYDSDPARHTTEKTFKPIAQQHPFILISRPKALEFLRKLGYKSFSPFIDESYDNEIDNNKRLLMIAKEAERLANLTPIELTEFLTGVRNICKHNYEVLMNKTEFVHDLN